MKIIFAFVTILLLLAGCASNRPGSTESSKSEEPEWWFNPATSDTYYFAFGQAKKSNPSLAQKAATERARQEISTQVKVAIQSELRDWMQASGTNANAQALEFTENTIISVSDNVMQGATPDKYEKGDDGTVFVRVSYLKNSVDKSLIDAAKREEALYNEFKATQAFQRLEKKTAETK